MENNEERFNSFITKEELIVMINNLHFKYVNNLHMNLITGCIINMDHDDPKFQDITPLYYTIDIS